MNHSVRRCIHAAVLLSILVPGTFALDLSPKRPVVIVRSHGGEPVGYGASMLQRHLAKISGRPVTVLRKDAPPADAIVAHVGRTEYVQKRFGGRLDKLPRDESYIIRVEGDRIILAGKGARGAENAVMEFLRKYCGIEQYIPGEIGTVYTKAIPLVLADSDETYTPPFVQRLMYSPVRDQREHDSIQEWLRFHHRAQTIDYHHSFFKLLKQTEYGKSHPEYFSLVNGRRRVFTENVHSAWQPCMTNAEGIRVMAEEVIRRFDADPDLLSVSIAVNDGGGYCECKNCRPLWDVGKGAGECSRLYYSYANRVAEIVEKKYPDKILGCLGYSSAGAPTDAVPAHRMIMPFITLTSMGAITDVVWEENIKAQIDQIARNTSQFGVYEYIHGAGTFIPLIFDTTLARTLKYAYSKGCRAVYFETGLQNWGLDVYKYALAMRMVWDPELDVSAYKDGFFKDFYGPSGPAMRRYFEAAEKAWRRIPRKPGILMRRERQMALFSEELVADCETALSDALVAAPDEIVARRVLMTKRDFALTAALVRRYWAGVHALEALDRKAPKSEVIGLLAPVAGPENDYDLLYAAGPVHDIYRTIQEPGESRVRMEATYSEARASLFSSLLDDVAQKVRANPRLRPADVAMMQVRDVFASADASAGANALMFDAAKTASCVARAPRVATAPVLDGKLTEAVWERAGVADRFVAYGKGGAAKFVTTVRLLGADGKLFLGFDCKQPTDVFWAAAVGRDGRVWVDDSIEILFNRPGETDENRFIQVIINCEGVIWDRMGKDKSWDAPVTVKTAKVADGWQLEMSLPETTIAEYSVGGATRFNAVRNKQKTRMGRTERIHVTYEEISNWFPAFKGNVHLLSRGWLLLD